MKYEVGDKVKFKNLIFVMDAEILEVYNNGEYDEFDYYIKFWDYEGNDTDVLAKEKRFDGIYKRNYKTLKTRII